MGTSKKRKWNAKRRMISRWVLLPTNYGSMHSIHEINSLLNKGIKFQLRCNDYRLMLDIVADGRSAALVFKNILIFFIKKKNYFVILGWFET